MEHSECKRTMLAVHTMYTVHADVIKINVKIYQFKTANIVKIDIT